MTTRPPQQKHGLSPMRSRLVWVCVFVGLMAATVILWLFDTGFWPLIAFAFLIACPLVFGWVLFIERRQNRTMEDDT